jgi:hypothetical protein
VSLFRRIVSAPVFWIIDAALWCIRSLGRLLGDDHEKPLDR